MNLFASDDVSEQQIKHILTQLLVHQQGYRLQIRQMAKSYLKHYCWNIKYC